MFDYAARVKYSADCELNIPTKVKSYSYMARKVKSVQARWSYTLALCLLARKCSALTV
jgi:hypothetical protein